jgi:hypothetical protein
MKKNTMATAIIAGLAGVAGIANISTAVNVNPDGLGQVLLYPYYTVNAGNLTALSVVNTTDMGKAVKVRFLDAMNSKETLDFNLYLSAYDVWTGYLFALSDAGPANISTVDTSCTVPGIEDGIFTIPVLPGTTQRYFPFRTALFGADQDTLVPGASSGNARTRTGHIEMIEMGSLEQVTPFGFGQALTHGENGRPAFCEQLERAWLATGTPGGSGTWFNDPFVDMSNPTGGMFGGAAIVNVRNGTYINYNAEAIDGFSASVQHFQPGNTRPNLNFANSGGDGPITSYVFDRGRLITSNWAPGNGADAVSAVLMREALFNEYEVDPDLGAASEWVVTFPTKYLYVFGPDRDAVLPPFMRGWGECEPISTRIYNREEDTFQIFELSPARGTPTLCREANVLWFQRVAEAAPASPIHGEPAYRALPTYLRLFGITQKTFNNGWLWLGFYDEDRVNAGGLPDRLIRPALIESAPAQGTDADRYYGLPAIGYWALRVININQGAGLQASYGGAYPHRSSRACFKGTYDNSAPCD